MPGLRVPLTLTLALVAVLVAAPGAQAGGSGPVGTECSFVNAGQCEAVVSPWIVLSRSGSEGWKLYCTSAAPYNWAQNGSNPEQSEALTFQRSSAWISTLQSGSPSSNTRGPNPPGTSDYFATNWDPTAHHSYRYGIGCSSANFAGVSAAAAGFQGRPVGDATAERALPSTGTTVVRRTCPGATRLRVARHGVGYFTRRAPARVAHDVQRTRNGRAVTYLVHTERAPARTRLQTTISCG